MSAKLEKVITVFTHKYWLALSLAGAFFCFFGLNRGGVIVFIHITFGFLILNVITGHYPLRAIPRIYWIAVFVCAYLMGLSILMAPHESHYRWMKNIPRMLVIIFGMDCLIRKKIDHRIELGLAFVLSLTVCWQLAAYHIFSRPQGTFTNIHQLASLCILAIPMLLYLFGATQSWYRYLFIGIAIMAFDLVLLTSSRPAFLAIISSALFAALFLVKGRHKWIGAASIILAVAIVYVTNYAAMADRLKWLIASLPEEERFYMWSKAWEKIVETDLLHWIFGNGIGYFSVPLPQHVVGLKAVSPHNFFFDLLYLNGVIGFILVIAGLSLLLALVIGVAGKTQNKNRRTFAISLIANFVSWLILCGLNFPLYSKYSIFPLAFILGPMFVVIQPVTDKK